MQPVLNRFQRRSVLLLRRASVQALAMAGMAHDMTVPGLENMHIQGFSDIQYHASGMPGDHSSFGLGQFNLFITNRLSNKLSVLGEVIIEADTTNAVGVDLERLALSIFRQRLLQSERGTISHGYRLLQHGLPSLHVVADHGGSSLPCSPSKTTAASFPFTTWDCRLPGGFPRENWACITLPNWATAARHDRRWMRPSRTKWMRTMGKSVNLGLYARPLGLPGFQAGFSIYRDSLHPAGSPTIGQTIFSGHAIYQSAGLEIHERSRCDAPQRGWRPGVHIPGFYSQVSKRFGKIRPYFRYEYVNVPRARASVR